MKRIFYFCLIPVLYIILATSALTAPGKPNILLIVADDLGYSDIGCFGSEIPTPNLDKLAGDGLRFTRFYNTARCSPSRASILTGLYPHQAGVGFLTSSSSKELRRKLGAPGYLDNLNDKCVTIAEVLRTAGYKTYLSGKWHVGQERPHWPVDRGFDRSFTFLGGYHYFDPIQGQYTLDDNPYEPEPDGFYSTHFITDRALDFLDGHPAGEPFFMYLAYTAPHWPLHAPEQDVARFEGKYMRGWDAMRNDRYQKMLSTGVLEKNVQLSPRHKNIPGWDSLEIKDKKIWDRKMAVYAAQVSIMDKGIGRVVSFLEGQGILDNTLIMFVSDNGGSAELSRKGNRKAKIGTAESWQSYGAWANLSNTPFRLFKHYVHEGGMRSPFIAYWPAQIQPGEREFVRDPCHIIDLMSTCIDVAGAEYPVTFNGNPVIPSPGRSLLPLFKGKSHEHHQVLYWEHEGNRALLDDDWKLVSRLGHDWELYRIDKDPSELNDLSGEYPERITDLSKKWQAWADDVGVVPWSRTGKFPTVPDYKNFEQ